MLITTKSKTFWNACALTVEAGTTGERGGDAGHGGRTYFRLFFHDNMGMIEEPTIREAHDGHEITLVLGGDAELHVLADGLQFAADTLRASMEHGTVKEKIEFHEREVMS